jgi:DNA modification methylase/transcriptional regulator with XRE-family HTH domain
MENTKSLLLLGNCLDRLKDLEENSVDTICTDPPYGLNFMNKKWDYDVPSVEIWQECLRVLKPGGSLLAFAGTRTQHRMAINIEDAGFILKDVAAWVYGCLSEDSEVLTRDGWVGYTEAVFTKDILVYDIENDVYKWEEPERWYEYKVVSDTAFSIKSEETDQIVSRGHRCLVERDGRLVLVTAEELSNTETFPFLQELPGEVNGLTVEKTYSKTVANVTPIEYSGVLWCPTVSTGAFVARRNGKIFVTGNSGFPKSLNVSKAIDKISGEDFMSWFPEWLNEYREKAGMTRKELAEHFPSKSGGTTGCVWNWENGIRTPSASQFNKLCKLLNIPVEPLKIVERRVLAERKGLTKTYNVGSTEVVGPRPPITAPATDEAKKWEGWGTALKPSWECISWAIKPPLTPSETETDGTPVFKYCAKAAKKDRNYGLANYMVFRFPVANLPANLSELNNQTEDLDVTWVIDDKKENVMVICPKDNLNSLLSNLDDGTKPDGIDDLTKWEPLTNQHATVKPTELMRWLCNLATPEGGTILDPFMGSGSTGVAALQEGFGFVGIEMEPSYLEIAKLRIANT